MCKIRDNIVFYQTQAECCDFDVLFRRCGYFCNDTVTTSANKLRDFQCKFPYIRMAMKDISRTDKSKILIRHTFNCLKHIW